MVFTLRRIASLLGVVLCLSCLALGCQLQRKTDKLTIESVLKQDSWEANRAIMKAAENSGNLEIGLQTGQKELDSRPDNAEARIMMARLQTISGLPEQALFTLEPLEAKPTPAYELEKARALLRRGLTAESRPLLEGLLAVNLDPMTQRAVRKLMAICEAQDGQHQKAQEIFRQLLVEREEASVRFNLGYSLMASNKYQDVVIVLKPLLDTPQFVEARYLAAAALGRLHNTKEARGLLEGYLSDAEINRLLGGKK
ncbi:MAG: hypothetical protein LBE31_12215 [Deltaproteobacteria bacterium]|jgi:Flp pilus assembly protein TadD|nr:hypothetical protein [Deltaproteobacteria bacterium]